MSPVHSLAISPIFPSFLILENAYIKTNESAFKMSMGVLGEKNTLSFLIEPD